MQMQTQPDRSKNIQKVIEIQNKREKKKKGLRSPEAEKPEGEEA